MPRGDRNQIMSYNVSSISDEAQAFSNEAKTVLNLISNNTKEITALEQLRDALLPKLMSGEIDVSQVELPTLPTQTVHTNGRLLGQ
ncbi:type I restriction-modification system specificity determinant [Bifidobacterium cebidarum]|uniref:Type I restriction-modification system specificity determinant n=2 Tax=Bifidobacterium cebidarum TaxID=2650773 RepID=A0A6I1GPI5_9BIFI|nr:type I restriction-modification system specificity determinant [Bifidobacterium cebidarum]